MKEKSNVRAIGSQAHPSPSYKWGAGAMSSDQTIRVEKWWQTKKAAVQYARVLFLRNPVLVRWHADGEPLSIKE
jgi:hypothetical protein